MTNHSLRGSEGSLPRTPLSSFVSAASVRYPSGDGGVPYIFLLFTSGSTPSYRVRIGSGKPSHFFSRPFFARAKLGPTPHRQSGSRGSLSSSLERGRIALAPEQVKTIGWLGTEKTKEEWSLQNKASFLAPSVAACKYSVGYLSPLAKSIHRRPRIIPSPFTKVRLILANSRLIPYGSSSQPFFGSAPPSPPPFLHRAGEIEPRNNIAS